MVSGGRGDPERMHDRDISGLAYRWNLSPELEADRRSLQVEHAELERQHLEMLASDCDAAAQIAHAEKVRMHVGRLHALIERLDVESHACEDNRTQSPR